MTEQIQNIQKQYTKEIQKQYTEKSNVIKKVVSFSVIQSNDSIALLQRLGPQFGVDVVILKKAGEEYTNNRIDPQTNKPTFFTGLVPEGNTYINVRSEKNDIEDFWDFWDAVRAEKASQQNSSNPPKI